MGVRKLLSSMWVGEGTADQAAEAVATSATGETQKDSVSPGSSSPGMRRNLTASAALSAVGGDKPLTIAERESVTTAMRRNTSASTLSELRRREQSAKGTPGLEGSCAAVVEAVACKLLELVLGKAAMLEAMRECTPSTIPEGSDEKGSDERRRRSSGEDCATSGGSSGGGGGGGGGSGCSSGAATTTATTVPPGIASSLQGYIMTIVKHLELPNSCIVAALIYVLRAVDGSRFSLSLTNWQPCLLAAFVISAKLSFDEPVWNEDFVKVHARPAGASGSPLAPLAVGVLCPAALVADGCERSLCAPVALAGPAHLQRPGLPDLALGGRLPFAALLQHQRDSRAVRGRVLRPAKGA